MEFDRLHSPSFSAYPRHPSTVTAPYSGRRRLILATVAAQTDATKMLNDAEMSFVSQAVSMRCIKWARWRIGATGWIQSNQSPSIWSKRGLEAISSRDGWIAGESGEMEARCPCNWCGGWFGKHFSPSNCVCSDWTYLSTIRAVLHQLDWTGDAIYLFFGPLFFLGSIFKHAMSSSTHVVHFVCPLL